MSKHHHPHSNGHAKTIVDKPKIQAPQPIPERPLLGESKPYRVKKYGIYLYQAVCIDPTTQTEITMGPANTYGVVASDLVEQIMRDILGDQK